MAARNRVPGRRWRPHLPELVARVGGARETGRDGRARGAEARGPAGAARARRHGRHRRHDRREPRLAVLRPRALARGHRPRPTRRRPRSSSCTRITAPATSGNTSRPTSSPRSRRCARAACGWSSCRTRTGRSSRTWSALGMTARFDFILDSQDEGVEKPDPRFFEIALAAQRRAQGDDDPRRRSLLRGRHRRAERRPARRAARRGRPEARRRLPESAVARCVERSLANGSTGERGELDQDLGSS